jgi:sensor histidine kinase YesM
MTCWSIMVFLEGAQVLMMDASHGYVLPLFHYFIWAALSWYPWALLTPFIFNLARRYPMNRYNWAERIAFPHFIAFVLCLGIQGVLCSVGGWLYTLNHEVHTSLPEMFSDAVVKRILFGLLAYTLVVATAEFTRLRDEIRLRQLHQAQLEARLASAELEKLKMQLQPHFLFNTLQAAITLVQEDPAAAEDVLLRLSQLLRITLDQMGANEIPLAQELEFLDLYLGIQRARFGQRLAVEIHADPATLQIPVPPLILQPLVENAIRHGIGKHKGDDCIEVFARLDNAGLSLEVWNSNSELEDKGENLFQRGVGLRNTRARLLHLYGGGASLVLRSIKVRGAVALIMIPQRLSTAAAAPAFAGAVR